jgi:hypothetical protein
MDGHRFDALARRIALAGSRRSLVKAVTAAFADGVLGTVHRPTARAGGFQGTTEPIECAGSDACGPCGVCVQGYCTDRCMLDCLRCNPATGTCVSTCQPCQTCTPGVGARGGCVDACASCQRCNEREGTCEDRCGNCATCDVQGLGGGGCILKCPSICQQCDSDSGTCIDTCGPCAQCDARELLGGGCVPKCRSACHHCDPASRRLHLRLHLPGVPRRCLHRYLRTRSLLRRQMPRVLGLPTTQSRRLHL